MERPKLNRLTAEVVNQIAAGEVIERPASVVKELLDNAIDAKAGKVTIRINGGGMKMIEISDDGIGIPKENLDDIFDAHTTSKLRSIEDLNTLMSMGFRGEALSTITSIAKVTVVSKFEEDQIGYEIGFSENGKSEIKKSAREKGTSVKVEDLFYNIPARRKYLKSEQTEYRKIYELLAKYFLVYPNIHFVLEKDGKKVLDLPEVKDTKHGTVQLERVKDIFPDNTGLAIFYDGSGISMNGYIAHPSLHGSKVMKQYVFINGRPITERGIVRAVYEGYSRYLPFGEKIPFVLNLTIRPDLVDVNVHPRKEEVRFENAFRIYSAVQEAVQHTLEKALSYNPKTTSGEGTSETPNMNQNSFADVRSRFVSKGNTSSNNRPYMNGGSGDISFNNKASSVRDSLLFSKQAMEQGPMNFDFKNDENTISLNESGTFTNLFQIFDKYIVIEFIDERLWVIDQHAAAERINFERISKNEKDNQNIQTLLVPQQLSFTPEEKLFLEEYKQFFSDLGFSYEVTVNGIDLNTTPVEFTFDIEKMFKEMFELADNPAILKQNFEKLRHDILATIACHTSVRSGKKLDRSEMISIFNELVKCQNPYSCPHGRPAIWKLTLDLIDKNFERTY
ncbi:DNA mismatch repair endonuclease MutL [Patescibacteria group bacterium]|nr:DNA mismatch repair endonuclease MutL [Patescibacteria group bacterium]